MDNGSTKYTKNGDVERKIGLCLACGTRLSLCGLPFSADIRCLACGAINEYRQSFQAVRLIAAVEQLEVVVACLPSRSERAP